MRTVGDDGERQPMSDQVRPHGPSREGAEVSRAMRSLAATIFGWLDDNAMLVVIFVLALNISVFVWLPSLDRKYTWAYILAGLNLSALVYCAAKFRVRRR
jgi:hypothetical protein